MLFRFSLRIAILFAWIFSIISVLCTSLFIPLLIVEALSDSFDCKSASIFPSFIFLGLFPALLGAVIFILIRKSERRPIRHLIIFFSILIVIQISGLGLSDYLARHLPDKCDEINDQSSPGKGWDSILIGMTESQVRAAMGTPWSIHGCKWEFVHSESQFCAKTYVYTSGLAPVIPDYPVVFFDKA
jgi:hypothetical protein